MLRESQSHLNGSGSGHETIKVRLMGQPDYTDTNHLQPSQDLVLICQQKKTEPPGLFLRPCCHQQQVCEVVKEFQLHAPHVLALLLGHVQKNVRSPLATRAMHFPGLLGKLSPHRRHLADLSFRAEVRGDWKWITPLAWWFIMTFPWLQVLSYTLPQLFFCFTLWLMLANSPTRKAIKWFPERKRSCWGLQASMPDAQGNSLGCSSAEFYSYCPRMCYDFCFFCTVYPWYDMLLFIGADFPTLLYCWPAFISSLTLLTLASIWQFNTLHHSAMLTLRTDVELIAGFLFPIFEVTNSCPSLNPERFF